MLRGAADVLEGGDVAPLRGLRVLPVNRPDDVEARDDIVSLARRLEESGGTPGVVLREVLAGAGAVLVRRVRVLLTRNRGEPERARPLAGDVGVPLAVIDPGR